MSVSAGSPWQWLLPRSLLAAGNGMLSSTGSVLTSDTGSLFSRLAQIRVFWVGSVLPQSPALLPGPAPSFEQGRSDLAISAAA